MELTRKKERDEIADRCANIRIIGQLHYPSDQDFAKKIYIYIIMSAADFKYAGIIFVQGNQVLGALQRKWIKVGSSWNEERFISGFGGAAEPGETSLRAAIRETLEEIYEFITIPHHGFNINSYPSNEIYKRRKETKIPEDLLQYLENIIQFKPPYIRGNYHLYQLNYFDLNIILNSVYEYLKTYNPLIISIAYRDKIPKDIDSLLISQREDLHSNIEVLQIINLPIDNFDQIPSKVAKNFTNNVDEVKRNTGSIHRKF